MAITLSVIQGATELEPRLAPDASVEALAAYRFGVSSAPQSRSNHPVGSCQSSDKQIAMAHHLLLRGPTRLFTIEGVGEA